MIKIGVVYMVEQHEEFVRGFEDGIAKYSHSDASKVLYIKKGPLGSRGKANSAIKELLDDKVDLLFVVSTPAALEAKTLTAPRGTPVVFISYAPLRSGVVKSLTRHGCNMTGISVGGGTEKALEWLLRLAPDTKRILVPSTKTGLATLQSLEDLRQGSLKANVELLVVDVKNKDALARTLEDVPKDIDAIWLLNSLFFIEHIDLFVQGAIKHKLPLATGTDKFRSGALMSYCPHHYKTGIQASRLAHKILEGTHPSDLPIETADFFFGLNLDTASKIGLEVPEGYIEQAEEIVRGPDGRK